jgi:hypothetical protein
MQLPADYFTAYHNLNMSDPSNDHGNAQAVEDSLTNHSMPPGGPYWSNEQLILYRQWRSEGYRP